MITKQELYKAALYCRLSQDDGQIGESGSIQTQKALLKDYALENGYGIGDWYCDDGWSGTNFERPEFKRMIADIDAGKINMVIVKDLSRFGREYAQMGMLIEHYFDENGVRFIAISEGIDTLKGTDNILMPITNVINSLYARDCSRKTKIGHRTRAKEGKYLGSHAPFGYLKDPTDRHHLVIDPEAAQTVKYIFKMFSEGIGYVRITKILREQKILNPQAYFNQQNPDFYKSDYWRKAFDWHATSIRAILSNEAYIGQTVFGKTKTKGFYNKTRVKAPEKEWVVVENTHEPIIGRQLWDDVHKLMKFRRRENEGMNEIQMFAGLVKCADCGSALNVSFNRKTGRYTSFSCWVYKNYGKERCSSHSIGWKTLCELVLTDIRFHSQMAGVARQKYFDMLIAQRTELQKKEAGEYKRKLKNAEKRLGELDKILAHLYEDYALGKISTERYESMQKRFTEEQEGERKKQLSIKGVLDKMEESYQNTENFMNLIERYTDIKELNTETLNQLIDRIVIHEKTVNVDGSKSQRVDIYYRFIGYVPMSLPEIESKSYE